jgi:hypothetical protein
MLSNGVWLLPFFSYKVVRLITVSTSGVDGHNQLKNIMNTLAAIITEETRLLISRVKSKININGEIDDESTKQAVAQFVIRSSVYFKSTSDYVSDCHLSMLRAMIVITRWVQKCLQKNNM